MSPEQLKANSYYKAHYDEALEVAKSIGPAWEELSNEQRETVRRGCIRYQQEMDAIGELLRAGVKP